MKKKTLLISRQIYFIPVTELNVETLSKYKMHTIKVNSMVILTANLLNAVSLNCNIFSQEFFQVSKVQSQ